MKQLYCNEEINKDKKVKKLVTNKRMIKKIPK